MFVKFKMLSRSKRLIKKKLLLLSLSATLLHVAQQKCRKRRSCWERHWISRRPTHGFTATLVRELEFENIAEFRVMFRMDVGTFENLLIMVAPLNPRSRDGFPPRDGLGLRAVVS